MKEKYGENAKINLNETNSNMEEADEKLNSALKFASDELKKDPKILLQVQCDSGLTQTEYQQMFAEVEKVKKNEGWLKAKSKKDSSAEKSL